MSIPKKNIKLLCGRPLIDWVVKPALRSGVFAEVWVSTDDDSIAAIAVEIGAKVTGQMSREFSVAPPEQHVPEVVVAAVAVHGDDRVDVPNERGERIALGRVELGAGNVLSERSGLDHAVVGRPGPLGDLGRDDVGGAFEVSAVERHETKRAPQLADLSDLRTLQQ